jgi:cytochrome b561
MNAQAYTIAASYYHWLVAIPLMGSIGSVLKCQQSPKEEKGKWMFRHKSLGLFTGLIVAPRLGYRILNAASYRNVAHPVGSGPIETAAANVSHIALYAFMTIMPATGIAMGCHSFLQPYPEHPWPMEILPNNHSTYTRHWVCMESILFLFILVVQ